MKLNIVCGFGRRVYEVKECKVLLDMLPHSITMCMKTYCVMVKSS